MSNQLKEILTIWQDSNTEGWVLGTVYKTEGSAYRKAGALMLIDSLGQYYGLLSGGCLEADIIRNARKVMQSGNAINLEYDSTDEDDWAYQLGIGCGGKIYITLQYVSKENDLGLSAMLQGLNNRETGLYHQQIGSNNAYFELTHIEGSEKPVLTESDGHLWLHTPIKPEPHLLVIGAGKDAQPVVSMAKILGWTVSIADSRAANIRFEQFLEADFRLTETGSSLTAFIQSQGVDAVISMTHNLQLDGDNLNACIDTNIAYFAMLGPRHRFNEVIAQADFNTKNLPFYLSSPAGLDIGGHLPESIALSMLSECHAVINNAKVMTKLHLP